MMTSQSVSLKNVFPETPAPAVEARADEPIRGPVEVVPAAKSPSTESAAEAKVLMRRTAPLPALKSVFQYDTFPKPASAKPAIGSVAALKAAEPEIEAEPEDIPPAASAAPISDRPSPASQQATEDLTAAWEQISQLNEELRKAVREREQAVKEGILLREQLKQADEQLENLEKNEKAPSQGADLARTILERDAANLKR
jgi:hypothetical protein